MACSDCLSVDTAKWFYQKWSWNGCSLAAAVRQRLVDVVFAGHAAAHVDDIERRGEVAHIMSFPLPVPDLPDLDEHRRCERQMRENRRTRARDPDLLEEPALRVGAAGFGYRCAPGAPSGPKYRPMSLGPPSGVGNGLIECSMLWRQKGPVNRVTN
jgi:hypothetical protein